MLPTIDLTDLLIRVSIAIAAGGLIGLERERRPNRKYAGLRTLALLCGAGPIAVTIAVEAEFPAIVAIYFALAVAIALMIAYIRIDTQQREVGFTTSVTVFLVAGIGVLIGYGLLFEATAIAIVTAIILSEKEALHGLVDRLTEDELSDSLKLIAIVFILYPIAPDEPIDPFEIVVPQEVLLFAIFVLLIQFTSYVLMRQIGGSRGVAMTGLLAGGANSFATAGVLARLEDRLDGGRSAVATALMLASVSMITRNVAIASILAVGLVGALWQPALAMVVLAAAFAYLLWERDAAIEGFEAELTSPFSLRQAATFATLYVAILVGTVLANEAIGSAGLIVTAMLGGLVSSAAVAVTAATVFNDGTVGVGLAAGMVVVGIVASLVSKIAIIQLINRRLTRTGAIPLAIIGLVGLIVFVLT